MTAGEIVRRTFSPNSHLASQWSHQLMLRPFFRTAYPSCECEVASDIFVPVSGEGATRFLPLPFEPRYPIGSNRLQFEATRLSLVFQTSPPIDSSLVMFAFCVWKRSEYNNPCVHEPCWELAQRTRQRRWAQPPDSQIACKQGEYFGSVNVISPYHYLASPKS